MKDLFIPYEQALALKELGFDEGCLTFYPKEGKMGFDGKYHSIKEGYKNSTVNNIWIKRYKKNFECVAAPTFSQAFRFFREKYNLDSWVYRPDEKLNIWGYNTTLHANVSPFKSHEEAELECLKRLIQIAKKGNK